MILSGHISRWFPVAQVLPTRRGVLSAPINSCQRFIGLISYHEINKPSRQKGHSFGLKSARAIGHHDCPRRHAATNPSSMCTLISSVICPISHKIWTRRVHILWKLQRLDLCILEIRIPSGPKTWGNQRKAAGFGPALKPLSKKSLTAETVGIVHIRCPLCQIEKTAPAPICFSCPLSTPLTDRLGRADEALVKIRGFSGCFDPSKNWCSY